MGTTSIEWTASVDPETGEVVPGKTWNPLRGCSRVSQGCVNCYAETIAARFSDPGQSFHLFADRNKSGSKWTGKVELVEKHLQDPFRWRKPNRIFVNSMSDLFHEGLADRDIDRVFDVMESGGSEKLGDEWHPKPWHTFQILTKRPERMRDYMLARVARKQEYADKFKSCPTPEMRDSPAARYARAVATGTYFKQIWLGVSVEDQKTADERIPLLLLTPAAVRFVSYEPALGPVVLDHRWLPSHIQPPLYSKRISGFHDRPNGGISWLIQGGESGAGARPMHPAWAQSMRDQCAAAEVAYFLKQWGAWAPTSQIAAAGPITHAMTVEGVVAEFDRESMIAADPHTMRWEGLRRVGKKAAGALLDGVEWKQFPGAFA